MSNNINRPEVLPRSSSVTTGEATLGPVQQRSVWDAESHGESSLSYGNGSGSTGTPPVRSVPSSSYPGPAVPRISSPLESTSSNSCTSIERYNLHGQRGYVLIFHHKHFKNHRYIREGSEKDLRLLKQFFAKYNVEKPDICENYTVLRIKDKMETISGKDFSNYSCLIVIVMSHGETKDYIMAYDDIYNFEQEVVERVLMNKDLKGKPKLFFIQACKGNVIMECDTIPFAINKNDLLKCYSTYEGTVSLRDIVSGTYFIQILFSLIEEHPDKTITEIMALLRICFKNDRIPQAPTDTSTLTKKFYFRDLK